MVDMQEGVNVRLRDTIVIVAMMAAIFAMCYMATMIVTGWVHDAAVAYDILY